MANELRIDIHVRTERQQPLQDLPFMLVVDGRKLIDGTTDQDGRLTLITNVSGDDVYVALGFAAKKATPEYADWLTRYHSELRHQYHFAQRYPVVIPDERQIVSVEVIAWDAVHLKARIVDGRGVPRRGEVYGALYSYPALGPAGTTLQLPDVRRAAPLLLFVTSWVEGAAQLVHPVQLTAEDTAEEIDLGEVVIPARKHGVDLDVMVTGEALLRVQKVHTPIPGVVFVSGDGDSAVCYRAAPRDGDVSRMRLMANEDQTAHLAPGRYYIAPGYFLNNETQRALFEIVRDGKPEELEQLYSIDVPEDGYTGKIDLWDAYESIRKVMKARTEQSENEEEADEGEA